MGDIKKVILIDRCNGSERVQTYDSVNTTNTSCIKDVTFKEDGTDVTKKCHVCGKTPYAMENWILSPFTSQANDISLPSQKKAPKYKVSRNGETFYYVNDSYAEVSEEQVEASIRWKFDTWTVEGYGIGQYVDTYGDMSDFKIILECVPAVDGVLTAFETYHVNGIRFSDGTHVDVPYGTQPSCMFNGQHVELTVFADGEYTEVLQNESIFKRIPMISSIDVVYDGGAVKSDVYAFSVVLNDYEWIGHAVGEVSLNDGKGLVIRENMDVWSSAYHDAGSELSWTQSSEFCGVYILTEEIQGKTVSGMSLIDSGDMLDALSGDYITDVMRVDGTLYMKFRGYAVPSDKLVRGEYGVYSVMGSDGTPVDVSYRFVIGSKKYYIGQEADTLYEEE